ncbi:ABC transporter substrate-binding protein [Sinomicrobium soli]|uniref:ABC transporter substrate-binding protein n=1 Tax=Sinomicrobium sp. N-1-3-6 TaxID=2219864 RepID=UPI000DCE0798|nr:helical backbone metal receptor [Sinomicrobium sp. N-1-3-6]RAV28839.1 cobalamin-binding protein [Sinomicrobium sp. N-1-3-6]
MEVFKDQLGNILQPERIPPVRIVSLVPSQTELLYDLGLEEQVVGITKFCVHPYHFKAVKTVVGGTKKVHFDRIRELSPDIILCNKEENTREMVAELNRIAPVHVSDIRTIDDTLELVKQYGQLFACRTEASRITGKINNRLRDFRAFIRDKPVLKAAYFIWKDPWMVAGGNTFIDHLLTLNHFRNIYGDRERYPEIELKKIRMEGDPEIVLLSSEPYPFKEEHAFEIGRFTHHAKTVFVDGEMFSWYGSRLARAFDYFRQLRERL